MEKMLSDELWQAVKPLLPTHKPSPKGGAPRKDDRACLEGILYVLRTGCQWRLLPAAEFGVSGSTCWRRHRDWSNSGLFLKVHAVLRDALGEEGAIDLSRAVIDSASVRALKGGWHTGPNPTDRGKKGVKRHIVTDANGLPLLMHTGRANQRDEQLLEPMLACFPVIPNEEGEVREKPFAMQGDRGYGFPWIILAVLSLGIVPLLAPRGSPHGSGLGKTRYVVERSLAWIGNFRRIKLCYERNGLHFQSFNVLACCVVCANRLHQVREAKRADADNAARAARPQAASP
jgi:transposase